MYVYYMRLVHQTQFKHISAQMRVTIVRPIWWKYSSEQQALAAWRHDNV